MPPIPYIDADAIRAAVPVTDLLDVTHVRNPSALGPEGYPIDWHAVRATYRVRVDTPTEPRVTEAARLPLTDVAAAALSHVTAGLGGTG